MGLTEYQRRCLCKKKLSIIKKPKSERPLEYSREYDDEYDDLPSIFETQTFQIKYEKKLSSAAKAILNSFQDKYIYYAIDDILYSLKANPIELNNLLALLYSPILSLQNNFSINFFDIWIQEVNIEEITKTNKFLTNDSQTLEPFSYITIKLFYTTSLPIKKQETIW
jgi:hypothetical protein